MRARNTTRPSVGSVIREITFSRVLLPAPLRPMIPTTSPSFTLKETPFSAQKFSRSLSSTPCAPPNRLSAVHLLARPARTPLFSKESRVKTYSFERFSTCTIGCTSDDVGETPLHSSKDQQSGDE